VETEGLHFLKSSKYLFLSKRWKILIFKPRTLIHINTWKRLEINPNVLLPASDGSELTWARITKAKLFMEEKLKTFDSPADYYTALSDYCQQINYKYDNVKR
jgi:hypothetical protein